jgi:hypothetical protein
MKIVKLFSLFIIAMMLGCTGCAGTLKDAKPAESKEPSALIKHMGASTVALVYPSLDEVHAYCTGVWVGDNAILTAAHCVKGVAKRIAADHDEEFDADLDLVGTPIHYTTELGVEGVGKEPSVIYLAKAIYVNADTDLALVQTVGRATPSHDVAKLSAVSPAVGEKIHIVGMPSGLYFTYIDGLVAAYRTDLFEDKKGTYMQVSAPIYFGNSGGGVFDEDGNLCGIASFMMRAPSTGFFVHINTIKKMLAVQLEEK